MQTRQKACYVRLAGVAAGVAFAIARENRQLFLLDAIADGLAGFIIAAFVAHFFFGTDRQPKEVRSWTSWWLWLDLAWHGMACALALSLHQALLWACVVFPEMRQRSEVFTVFVSAGLLRTDIEERLLAKRSPLDVGKAYASSGRGPTLTIPVRADGAFAVRGFVGSSFFGTGKTSFEFGLRPVLKIDGKVEWRCGVLLEPVIWRRPGTSVLPATCRRKVASLDEL